jgi:hypothetical protein
MHGFIEKSSDDCKRGNIILRGNLFTFDGTIAELQCSENFFCDVCFSSTGNNEAGNGIIGAADAV